MLRRSSIGWIVALAAVCSAGAAGPATAASRQAPKKATLTAIGGVKLKPNRYIQDGMRFDSDVVTIRSGGTLTLKNRTSEPHTFSLVKRGDLPGTVKQMEKCFGGGACAKLAEAHGVTSPDAEPTIPLVNAGALGFDRSGDSALFEKDPLKLDVTAAKGKRLYYLCLIHPWMQGKVVVR